MALPLIIAGGVVGAKIIGSALLSPVSTRTARAAAYIANRAAPNEPPGVEALINAMLTGHLSDSDLAAALKESHGVSIAAHANNASQDRVWRACIEAQKGMVGIDVGKEMWLRGAINDSDFGDIVRRGGIYDAGAQIYLRERSEMGSPDLVISLYRQGKIPIEEARVWLRWLGYTDTTIVELLLLGKTPLDMVALYQLVNRGDIGPDKFYDELDQMGYGSENDKNLLYGLRNLIPGPSDLSRYAVRESWTQDVVDTFDYDAEFPAIFGYWMDKQGLGWETPAVTIDGVNYPSVSWPLAHWRAHWELPSPTQSYGFLQRARATGGPDGGWRIPGLPPFDKDKLDLLLKTKDYPPYFRPYLRAMSYHVMDVRSIRWAVQYGVFDPAEAIERYQDQGYNDVTAGLLAETDNRKKIERDQKNVKKFADATIAKLFGCILERYTIGGLDRTDAEARLTDLNVPLSVAQARLDALDVCWDTAQLKLAVAAVRRAYMSGELDWPGASQRLALAGVTIASRELYRLRWQVQFTPQRKALSTAQVLDALERGYIDRVEATTRLINLGWDEPDMVILYQTASRIVTERQMKIEDKAAASAAKAAAQIKQAAREADAQHRRLVADLNRIEPIGMLKRLAKKGELSIAYVTDSLQARDIPPSAISHYLEDFYGVTPEQPEPPPVSTGGPD